MPLSGATHFHASCELDPVTMQPIITVVYPTAENLYEERGILPSISKPVVIYPTQIDVDPGNQFQCEIWYRSKSDFRIIPYFDGCSETYREKSLLNRTRHSVTFSFDLEDEEFNHNNGCYQVCGIVNRLTSQNAITFKKNPSGHFFGHLDLLQDHLDDWKFAIEDYEKENPPNRLS